MATYRNDIRYTLGYGGAIDYPREVDFRIRPHRMYLTAERALNKDDTHSVLVWMTGTKAIKPNKPEGSQYQIDHRGEVVRIPNHYDGYLGWLRVDELNVPLNIVPLIYYTIKPSDTRRTWKDIATEFNTTTSLLSIYNGQAYNRFTGSPLGIQVGKTFIMEMGFPPTGDTNLFRTEHLRNNRYQNVSQPQMVSVKLQGRPNTRYLAKTSALRNPESNNHELFIGLHPSEPSQNNGFSFNEDMVFVTDDTGEIELSFYDSEVSGVNADYLDFLDNTYWIEILVHPNQVITTPIDMTLQAGNNSYGVHNGNNSESGLELKPGINEITIVGNGKISFYWNNEVMG